MKPMKNFILQNMTDDVITGKLNSTEDADFNIINEESKASLSAK